MWTNQVWLQGIRDKRSCWYWLLAWLVGILGVMMSAWWVSWLVSWLVGWWLVELVVRLVGHDETLASDRYCLVGQCRCQSWFNCKESGGNRVAVMVKIHCAAESMVSLGL